MGVLELLGIIGGSITILGAIISVSVALTKKHAVNEATQQDVRDYQTRYDGFSFLLGEINGKLGQILHRFDEVQAQVTEIDDRLTEVEHHNGIKLVNGKGNT